ncbi:hypothetical protein E1A91_D04G150000v1 [Gossypium mustelinum]|uniref:Uncharacterized protein n=1 Tax=Gossypium mustelinum TaxID=34275 RepID=A0A5D2VE50_GOSMU|nr:hypothetical protein E1A91_D04G150000v1 [Gossypium mustelinum]
MVVEVDEEHAGSFCVCLQVLMRQVREANPGLCHFGATARPRAVDTLQRHMEAVAAHGQEAEERRWRSQAVRVFSQTLTWPLGQLGFCFFVFRPRSLGRNGFFLYFIFLVCLFSLGRGQNRACTKGNGSVKSGIKANLNCLIFVKHPNKWGSVTSLIRLCRLIRITECYKQNRTFHFISKQLNK